MSKEQEVSNEADLHVRELAEERRSKLGNMAERKEDMVDNGGESSREKYNYSDKEETNKYLNDLGGHSSNTDLDSLFPKRFGHFLSSAVGVSTVVAICAVVGFIVFRKL